MTDNPQELRYTADHEWISADAPARVGITAHAAEQLGDVVYVELPKAGATVKAGEFFGEIESVKSVSELLAPVTGTVREVNEAVVDDPSLVNADPFGAGWLITVEIDSEGPLLSATEYEATLV